MMEDVLMITPTTVPDDAADDAINPVKVKEATGDMGKSC